MACLCATTELRASWLGQRARHRRWATWLEQHSKILFNPPRTGSLGTRQLIQLAHWSDRPTIWTAEHRFKSQTVGWVQPERRPVDGFLKHCYTKAKNRSHGYFYFFLPGTREGVGVVERMNKWTTTNGSMMAFSLMLFPFEHQTS